MGGPTNRSSSDPLTHENHALSSVGRVLQEAMRETAARAYLAVMVKKKGQRLPGVSHAAGAAVFVPASLTRTHAQTTNTPIKESCPGAVFPGVACAASRSAEGQWSWQRGGEGSREGGGTGAGVTLNRRNVTAGTEQEQEQGLHICICTCTCTTRLFTVAALLWLGRIACGAARHLCTITTKSTRVCAVHCVHACCCPGQQILGCSEMRGQAT